MKFSVIVPVFNEEKTIREVISQVEKVNLGDKITIKEIKRPDNSLALRLVEINLPEYIKWKEKMKFGHED